MTKKNKAMYILMICMFIAPLLILITGIPALMVFWAEEYNESLFNAWYNATLVMMNIVFICEFVMGIAGTVLGVIAYKKEETEKFPIVRTVYYLLGIPLFSFNTFVILLFIALFTRGMSV